MGDLFGYRMRAGKDVMRDVIIKQDGRKFLKQNSALKGRYVIRDILGMGGFGIVYLAEDIEKNAKVAIKEYFPYGKSYRMDFSEKILFKGRAAYDMEYRYVLFENEADILERVSGCFGAVSYQRFFYDNDTMS